MIPKHLNFTDKIIYIISMTFISVCSLLALWEAFKSVNINFTF